MVPVVFVCGRNTEKVIKVCLTSVCLALKRYGKGRVVFMDDVSDDRTVEIGLSLLGGFRTRYEVIRANQRGGRVALYQEALRACKGDDVVIGVDSDDWLIGHEPIASIMAEYAAGAWCTWGRDTSGWSNPVSFRLSRSTTFPEHPWTSFACLMKATRRSDLMFQGRYADVATDRFLFYPPFEMAAERLKCVGKLIYEYNYPTPFSVFRTDPVRQKEAVKQILSSRPYERLDRLP